MILKRISYFLFFITVLARSQDLRLTIIEQENECDNNIAYIHCHGLGGTHKQALMYCKSLHYELETHWVIQKPFITFDFDDVKYNEREKKYFRGYNKHQVNLGQTQDMNSLAAAYAIAEKKYPECRFVGHGVSRGGATWLNFCAEYNPEKICALIIESPFDDPVNVLKNLISYLPGADYLVKNLGVKLLRFLFPLWEENGIKPIDVVDKISTNIPLLFIHSGQDSLIPIESSLNLCQKLANSGHEVYCLILKSGGEHALIFHEQEGSLYNKVVHAFYKKYGLPHEPQCAQEGQQLLEDCKVYKQEAQLSSCNVLQR